MYFQDTGSFDIWILMLPQKLSLLICIIDSWCGKYIAQGTRNLENDVGETKNGSPHLLTQKTMDHVL